MTGRPGFKRQRGISLFVIMVIVLLSMLLALWASRTSWFGELVVGNDADYQRALEAAQAMLQDAELDIRRSKADGSACENLTGTGDLLKNRLLYIDGRSMNFNSISIKKNPECKVCSK